MKTTLRTKEQLMKVALVMVFSLFLLMIGYQELNSYFRSCHGLQNGNEPTDDCDPEDLLKEIRTYWLRPPSKEPYHNVPLKMDHNQYFAVEDLHEMVFELLRNKTNGFFVECGAYDGVTLSNTLHLERNHNWTGLLVEADPIYFQRLMTKHRKAWTINACLAIHSQPGKVRMTRVKDQDALTRISELDPQLTSLNNTEDFEAQCFPLAPMLAATGNHFHVDYLSLDVEGAELLILQTIPWDRVQIDVMTVEALNSTVRAIWKFLDERNYSYAGHMYGPWVHDYIFIRNDYALQFPVLTRKRLLPHFRSKSYPIVPDYYYGTG